MSVVSPFNVVDQAKILEDAEATGGWLRGTFQIAQNRMPNRGLGQGLGSAHGRFAVLSHTSGNFGRLWQLPALSKICETNMQIAVIGWGSLIWCPGSLRIKTRWRPNGPALPIEFARISRDRRLTLVIHPGSRKVRTYWAISELQTLRGARENLRAREGSHLSDIHSLTSDGRRQGTVPKEVAQIIRAWLKKQENVEDAIWTGLGSNWVDRRGGPFTPEDAADYLRELEEAKGQAAATYDRAREYVRNAPSQIQTRVRKMIQRKKGWEDAKLPAVLFETEAEAVDP